jgi:hypothetical protein
VPESSDLALRNLFFVQMSFELASLQRLSALAYGVLQDPEDLKTHAPYVGIGCGP